MVSSTWPVGGLLSAVLSQKPTIPHIPLTPPLQINVDAIKLSGFDRPLSPPIGIESAAPLDPAGMPGRFSTDQ